MDVVWNQPCPRPGVAVGWPPEHSIVKKPFSVSRFPAASFRLAVEEGWAWEARGAT